MRALLLVPFVLLGCGPAQESSTPHVTANTDALTRCFASAYDEADKDAAFAQCESKHFGTEWRTKAKPKDGAPLGSGHLDQQLLQASVDARLPRMKACFAAGLRKDATLRGTMKFKFVIDTTGHAINVEDAGSHMKDKQVLACVLQEFKALRTPNPEGGIVNVVYPLVIGVGDTSG